MDEIQLPKVSIVILNYNTVNFLKTFLPFVLKTEYPNFEICVIDNASNDHSVEYIQQNFSSIKTICLEQNYGFAGGYNRGLAQIDAEYIVLLNSDVEVTPNWLMPLVKLALSDQNISVIQPKILDYATKSHFEYAGGCGGYIDIFGYPMCRGRWFNITELDKGQYNDSVPIFWASGACFFIKQSDWKLVGGLDDDFFAHMEEIDLCWRLKNLGKQIMVCPDATVYHVGGGTLPVGNPRKVYLNFRNGLYLLLKNTAASKLFLIILIRLILDGLAGIKFLSEFKIKDIYAILKAHLSFYMNFIHFYKKRVGNENSKHNEIITHSIVKLFYLKKQKHFSDIKW